MCMCNMRVVHKGDYTAKKGQVPSRFQSSTHGHANSSSPNVIHPNTASALTKVGTAVDACSTGKAKTLTNDMTIVNLKKTRQVNRCTLSMIESYVFIQVSQFCTSRSNRLEKFVTISFSHKLASAK